MEEQKKKFLTSEVKIGITVCVAIAFLYFGINYLKGINIFNPNTVLYVQYSRVDGIVKTTHIMINGYQVGHVSDIIFDYTKEAPITLELTVDRDLVVPKGTTAEVYDTGLMGDKAIQLHLGHSSDLCVDGDTIEGTISGGLVDQVIGMISPSLDRLVPQIDSTLIALRRVIEDENLKKILANTEGATAKLNTASGKLNGMMESDIPEILAKVKTITANLDKISKDISEEDLHATLDTLSATLANLKEATDKMKSTDNTLGSLLNDKAVYNHIDSTIVSANELLIDLKANPKRYVHFSVFGSKEKTKKTTDTTNTSK